MKVGDLVKVRDRGLSLAAAKEYLGHIGVIFEIREKRGEVFVFINDKLASFLPRYIEVINESR
jgi:hypothetical protein